MEMFSTSSALQFGWNTFKKRPWFLVGITLLAIFLIIVASAYDDNTSAGLAVVAGVASFILSTFVNIWLTQFALRAHDDIEKVSVYDLWRTKSFWSYLAVSILVCIAVIAGIILLIVPGIIFAIMYVFSNMLVIDRDLGPIEAMKESARITYGNRMELLLFFMVLIILNIVGTLALFVGLLITLPVSMLAFAHAYRVLASQNTTSPDVIIA